MDGGGRRCLVKPRNIGVVSGNKAKAESKPINLFCFRG